MPNDVLNRLTKALQPYASAEARELRPRLSAEEWRKKYVYPPQHAHKSRPKQKYDHIIPLLHVIEIVGKSVFGGEWKGYPEVPYEWYARSPECIKTWNDLNEDQKSNLCSRQTAIRAVQFDSDQDEMQAYVRKQGLYSKLVTWLSQGKLQAFILLENGERKEIQSHAWIQHQDYFGNYAYDVFRCGRVSGKAKPLPWYGIDPNTDAYDLEIVYVDAKSLDRLLAEIKPQKGQRVPVSLAQLQRAYQRYVGECEEAGRKPSWKDDLYAMEVALGKKPTQKQIKNARAQFAPNSWKARGAPKKKTD